MKLADVRGPSHLGDERDDPLVEPGQVNGAHVELLEERHDLMFDDVPEGLEELNL